MSANPLMVTLVAGVVPLTVVGDCGVLPMNGVIVYLVSELPPSDEGAVQFSVADPSPGTTTRLVGALGIDTGTTGFDGADPALVPRALAAATMKV